MYVRPWETAEGDGTSLLRVGRLLWTQLLVRPGDRLELERCPAPSEADTVVLRPAFRLSHNLGDRAVERMRQDGSVLWPGALVFAPVLPGGGGVMLRVEATDPVPAVIGVGTQVTFEQPDPQISQRPLTFAEVGGLEETVNRLRDLVELPLLRPGLFSSLGVLAPKGVLLHGPPGTGKTLVSRALAHELGVNVMTVHAGELVGAYSGETESNLRSLFDEAAHHAPTLIVVDEIDVLTPKRSALASQGDIRATSQLLTLMDGLANVDGVVVLGTTNRVEAVDEAFRRPGRFDEELYVGPPDARARHAVLTVHTREMPLTAEAERALVQIAESRTPGFTGADLMRLAREAGLIAARRAAGDRVGFEVAEAATGRFVSVEATDFLEALAHVSPSALRGLSAADPVLAWGSIAGLDDVKRQLDDAALAILRSGRGRGEGLLLSGPPGNGKSVLLQALAHRHGANLVVVDGSAIFTQWLGESEAAVRALFRKACEVTPAVVALEHLDALAPRRVPGQTESASSRVLSALLSCVDEALRRGGVLVVGLTDRPDMVDTALTRAGRLGRQVTVGAPDEQRREQIVRAVLGPDAEERTVASLVASADGCSAAEVERRALDAQAARSEESYAMEGSRAW